MNKRRSAFTLVEILVVLAIITILAAILFPAFNRVKENARQTSCASNLSQIGFAVLQYRKDEGRYPDSLVDILGEGAKVADPQTTGDYKLDSKATGYLKGGLDSLTCPDDDTLPAVDTMGRSSYGLLSKTAPATAATDMPTPVAPATSAVILPAVDTSNYVWNYWGTRGDGFTYATPALAASGATGASPLLVNYNPAKPAIDPANVYNQKSINPAIAENLFKYSMSNRFAPPTTIITHCVYHRLPTANDIAFPGELYADPAKSTNAKDIILRVDGSAKAIDVSKWLTPATTANPALSPWRTQNQ